MTTYSGADWMQKNLDAANRMRSKRARPIATNMSPLGRAVADLLGDVFLGIYHLDQGALLRVEWNNTYCIVFNLSWRDLTTVDGDELTRLVVLCHDRMIRMSIDGCGPCTMKLTFHQRTSRGGNISARCPTLEDHIEAIRNNYNQEPLP